MLFAAIEGHSPISDMSVLHDMVDDQFPTHLPGIAGKVEPAPFSMFRRSKGLFNTC